LLKASKLLVVAALLAFAAVGPAGASSSQGPNSCGTGSVSFSGPDSLWPPNHKPVTETVTYSGGTMPGDTLNTAGADNEEAQDASGNYTEAKGSGHTDTATDVDPRSDSATVSSPGQSVSTSHALRSERAGTGSGRVYTIHYEVDNAAGVRICMGDFTVDVPHDQGGGNDA
jgi:hypothetical protein